MQHSFRPEHSTGPRLRCRTARRSVPTSEVIGLHPGVRPLTQSHLSTSELWRFLRKRHVCGAGPLGDRSLPRMPSGGDLGGFYNFGLPVKRLKPRQRWRRSHGEEEGYPRLRRGLESIAHRMTRITIEPQKLTLARLSRNDSIGSVVLAASSSAKASLFTRYGPSIGPRLALASSCERIRDAIPFLPTESFRPSQIRKSFPDLVTLTPFPSSLKPPDTGPLNPLPRHRSLGPFPPAHDVGTSSPDAQHRPSNLG